MNIADGFYSDGYLIISVDEFKRFEKECEEYGYEKAIEMLKNYNAIASEYLELNKGKLFS